MVYCSNCGAQIGDDVYFCPKCGTKTPVGKAAKVAYPSEELRDAFYQVGIELEKAFTLAAEEMHSAFKRVAEDRKEKTANAPTQDTIVCPKCGTKNLSDSIFCNNCGTKIATT
jgi:DNA-directed RNA polymerase subunit RPC12/RpoP